MGVQQCPPTTLSTHDSIHSQSRNCLGELKCLSQNKECFQLLPMLSQAAEKRLISRFPRSTSSARGELLPSHLPRRVPPELLTAVGQWSGIQPPTYVRRNYPAHPAPAHSHRSQPPAAGARKGPHPPQDPSGSRGLGPSREKEERRQPLRASKCFCDLPPAASAAANQRQGPDPTWLRLCRRRHG